MSLLSKPVAPPPRRFSALGLVLALVLVFTCAAASRTLRLESRAGLPLMDDMRSFSQRALELGWSHPFSTEMDPMTLWINRGAQEVGRRVGLPRDLAIRLSTFFISLATVLLLFFLARLWTSDLGATFAALYLALSPILNVYDVSGGRDTPYIFFLTAFSYAAFRSWERVWPQVLAMGLSGGLMALTRLNGLFTMAVAAAASWAKRRGRRLVLPWLATVLAAILLVGPFLIHIYQTTGDPLYTLNVHANWHSSEDPAAKPVDSFWDFFKELGPARLIQRVGKGAYLSLWGDVALDSFFSRRSLPAGLYLLPFAAYLLGMAAAIRRRRWEPFLMILLATGPVWPLIAVGTDPRLLLGALPFMAVFLGMGVDLFWQRARRLFLDRSRPEK